MTDLPKAARMPICLGSSYDDDDALDGISASVACWFWCYIGGGLCCKFPVSSSIRHGKRKSGKRSTSAILEYLSPSVATTIRLFLLSLAKNLKTAQV